MKRSAQTPGQLELDSALAEAPVRSRTRGHSLRSLSTRALFGWAPVWLPLILVAHFTLLGLLPTRQRSLELEHEGAQIELRTAELLAQRERLQLDWLRLADPIYRERVRRSLVTPGVQPLTLDRARSQQE